MKLYNTLMKKLDPVTSEDGTFRMYICGVTPYDTTHLGHAFTYVSFDVLARYLEFKGFKTLCVQNVTDIDDDILRRAKKVGMTWDELGKQETQKYLADMKALNVRPPDHYLYATEEIDRIVEMVSDLVQKGYAYEKNGSVYYDTQHDPDFATHLVDMNYEEQLRIANERGNLPDDPNKRDPLDFVLWQAAQPDEPVWQSPWGEGRPGWHIECSAMSMHYLGPKIDIHSGGADLIFPHHSCEIVQSEKYSGEHPFVRYWFHIAMVHMDGEKMSKSLGNMLFVRDLLKTYSADAIRMYLLQHKYRDEWTADDAHEALASQTNILSKWQQALALSKSDGDVIDPTSYRINFTHAMDDDLDTPLALRHLNDLANMILDRAAEGANPAEAQATLRVLAGVLGLKLGAVS